MTSKKDIVVGLFVIVAIIILTMATMVLRHYDVFNRRDTYYVLFNHVKQLDIGSPVLAFGVNVGTVTNLEYISDQKRPIKVTIRIDRAVKLFSNAQIRVNPAQVIGSTTMIIDSVGWVAKDSHLLKPGDTILSYEPMSMDTAMNDVFQGLSRIINSQDTQTAVKQIIMNMDSVTRRMDDTFRMINEQFIPMISELKTSSNNLNKLLTEAQQAVARAADSVSSASASIQSVGAAYGESGRTLNREIQQVADRLETTIAQAQKTLSGTQQPIDQTLGELQKSSRALSEILEKINRGEGTLGKLISDPSPFQDLKTLIDAISARILGGGGASTFPQIQKQPAAPSRDGQGSSFPKVQAPAGAAGGPRR